MLIGQKMSQMTVGKYATFARGVTNYPFNIHFLKKF